MPKETILVVEDDLNISRLLQVSLLDRGYEVLMATRGEDALELCREHEVDIIVLDIRLPDLSGYEVGEALRAAPQTQDIPIIVLTAFTERQDKLDAYRRVRAEHFLGKPFDIEELLSVIKVHLERAHRRSQYHPVTELPTGELVNAELRRILAASRWTLAFIRINGFESFTQHYGSLVGENVLKFTARRLEDAVHDCGDPADFIGHLGVGPYFIVISPPSRIEAVASDLTENFDRDIKLHYDYRDRRVGYLEVTEADGTTRRLPMMHLTVAVLSSSDGPFRDIRELTEAGERLLQEAALVGNERGYGSTIIKGRAE